MNKANKFADVMGAVPIEYKPKKPNADRVRSIGRSLPSGEHLLNSAQQRAWFGGVVFHAPVAWKDDAFVCDGETITPAQVVARARE